jgi:hypothetical protein
VEKNLLAAVALDLAVGFVVYVLAVQLCSGSCPGASIAVPGTLVSFSAPLSEKASSPDSAGACRSRSWGGARALAFFIAVKVGTPGSVVLTIDTDGVSGHADELAREGFLRLRSSGRTYFNVEKYGGVVFELLGKPGTVVTVEFPPDNTPFGKDREGKPRTTFTGTVPGRINASPALVPSRGKFLIRKKDPDTGEVIVNDPTWDLPRRND